MQEAVRRRRGGWEEKASQFGRFFGDCQPMRAVDRRWTQGNSNAKVFIEGCFMVFHKDVSMVPTKEAVDAAAPSVPATSAAPSDGRIQWAVTPTTGKAAELEANFEAMRSRNWITDKMVEQYQKHWHCSREVALERLLAKAGK
jgi:hypothetical protein